ncbi:D-tyrosyl-tRNA(Tyr) deacylase [Taibaiella sp. KBW10]|uniref:D-aminoacyl-tRNA deacylase n=1 Tax=Taibaiella sp. KBW10 TaxID=2153357 RepID=UPI000F5A0652|nr:D-aminoacyl-tRNA deacylase [Taibaiella sp. KBW10]RQO31101.1 D-tyrosyl-tRNA(Tyr) deacylase [Taibaiella sp. KBW10]
MKLVIQRVSEAAISIEDKVYARIDQGLLVLIGIGHEDDAKDISYLVQKLVQLRIFGDEQGLMNRSVRDIDGDILLVSQFTLFAATKKGNRPSFMQAARPDIAVPLYEQFKTELEAHLGKPVATGVFGADMKVSLVNDGPVTILMDSKFIV